MKDFFLRFLSELNRTMFQGRYRTRAFKALLFYKFIFVFFFILGVAGVAGALKKEEVAGDGVALSTVCFIFAALIYLRHRRISNELYSENNQGFEAVKSFLWSLAKFMVATLALLFLLIAIHSR